MAQDDLSDRRNEARIRELTAQIIAAYDSGDREESRRLDALRMQAIRSRSVAQIERMERQRGLN